MRIKLCSLVTAASLSIIATLAGTAAAATAPSGPPTATGTGGAAATVETLATQAAIDTLRHGGNAVDAAVTAAAVLGVTEPFSAGIGGGGFLLLRTAGGAVTSIDHRETAPAHDAGRLVLGERRAAAVHARPLQRALRRRPRHRRRLGRRARTATERSRSRRRLRPRSGSPARGSSSTRPSSRRPRGTWTSSTTSRHRPCSSSTPTGRRRTSARSSATPISRAYERIAHLGAKGFYRGAIADALVETVQRPPVSPTANQRLATWADDDARPAHVRGARAGADSRLVSRPRRLRDGTAVERRLDRRRGAQHPRGLPARKRDARAPAAPVPRSVALLVRRPGRVPGRRGLRRRPAARAPLGRIRGDAAGADQGDRRAGRRPARRPVAVRRRPRPAARGRVRRPRGALDDAPERLRPWGNVVSYTFTIESTGGSGARRPRLGVPAQQRADRLRLRAPAPSEQRRGRQAAAQLDGADDRDARRANRC